MELTDGFYSGGDSHGVARVNEVTPVSLGYPLSVFNKNSTLKGKKEARKATRIPRAVSQTLPL